ncbi:hypothetical protein T484DRAFT_1753869 [Baffinella frigidus]|nr:hypothetical protein T484DRAFT_1753869 [Cryptophyta sp. CCMP2293]
MSHSDECVGMVKHMTAELFREQRELVQRLNAMHAGIEEDEKLMVESLQGALEADASGGMVATSDPVSFVSDGLSDVDDTESEVSDCDHVTDSATPLNPRDFSKIFCEQPPATASYVNQIQTELFTSFMTNLDQGFICIPGDQPAPSEARRWLLEPPSLPPAAEQPRALWAAQSADGVQQGHRWVNPSRAEHGAPTSRTASSGWWFRAASSGTTWFARRLSMPELGKDVRETLSSKMRRMSTSIIGA